MNDLFTYRIAEKDPLVIKASPRGNADMFYGAKQLKGDYMRVIPTSWREVLFIQSLEKGYSLFAPWNGDGVLIKTSYLPPFSDYRN